MWAGIERTGSWQGEIWDRRKNGEMYPKLLTISAVKDAEGLVTNYIGTHNDISAQKKAAAAMTALNRDLLLSRQRLRDMAAQNETRREGERKQIARDVHDELGQVLTALRIDLTIMEMRFGALDPGVHGKVQDMKALVDRAIQGMRERALVLGGEVHITSVPDEGTLIRLLIPIDTDAATGEPRLLQARHCV